MNFSMVKISGKKHSNGEIRFESMIMEKGASTRWTNTFESQYELVSIVNGILSRQKKTRENHRFLTTFHDETHYFFDLDLTEEQAETLGWRRESELMEAEEAELVGAR